MKMGCVLYNCYSTISLLALLSHIQNALSTRPSMLFPGFCLATLLSGASRVSSAPVIADPTFGPLPGQSFIYSTYYRKEAPFPTNYAGVVLDTTDGKAGADDILFQNKLSA
jgi:hypothetical protein